GHPGSTLEALPSPPMPVISHHAEIIDAVHMIGMVVSVDHAVEPARARIKQLLANVRRAVHEHGRGTVGVVALHEKRAASPPVLRIVGIARAPDIADPRHAAGCAAAKNGDFQRHAAFFGAFRLARGTLLNRRRKLLLVARASPASLMSFTAASREAVWITKAGSLVLPRMGSGVR